MKFYKKFKNRNFENFGKYFEISVNLNFENRKKVGGKVRFFGISKKNENFEIFFENFPNSENRKFENRKF